MKDLLNTEYVTEQVRFINGIFTLCSVILGTSLTKGVSEIFKCKKKNYGLGAITLGLCKMHYKSCGVNSKKVN